jgi:SH3-like domain-containing protein
MRPAAAPLAIVLACAMIPAHALARARSVELSADAAIHSGPSEDFFVILDAKAGDSFELMEEREAWVKVRMPDGAYGWVQRAAVQVAGVAGEEEVGRVVAGQQDAIVSAERAKLYAGPGWSYVVVKRVGQGTRLQVLGRDEEGNWIKVRLDGPPAWVRASLVDVRVIADLPLADEVGSGSPPPLSSDDYELEAALAENILPIGAFVGAGLGFTQLTSSFRVDDEARYKIPVPAFAFLGNFGYWFDENLGAELRARFDWAPKRFNVDPVREPAFEKVTPEAQALTVHTLSLDVGAVGRVPVLKPGAYATARLGLRYFDFYVDPIGPNDGNGEITNPAFYSSTHVGAFLGFGIRLPLVRWAGVYLDTDVTPLGTVSNGGESPEFDTPSGDIDSEIGIHASGGFWLTPWAGDFRVDIEVRGYLDQFTSTFAVAEGKEREVPRGNLDLIGKYRSAESTETAFGAVVLFTLRP